MKSKKVAKQVRKQYSPEFKKEALLRAERDGAAVAAKDLGLNVSQLYSWRAKERVSGQVSEEQRLAQSENARLKRELARLEDRHEGIFATGVSGGLSPRAAQPSAPMNQIGRTVSEQQLRC